ncbi:MAG: hypothetical protein V3T77_08825, partial [Planctomycetota bacterium]
MVQLAASLLALAIGPLLHQLALSTRSILSFLDGFILFAIGGLVLMEILPESVALAGWGAVPVALAGLLVPALLERMQHKLAPQAHRAALYLALAGILMHAFIDGVALMDGGDNDRFVAALPLAVILHRVPIGLNVWLLLSPAFGVRIAISVVVAMAAATVAGYLAAESVASVVGTISIGLFAALVGGALMHVVVHLQGRQVEKREGRWQVYSGLGALAAAL